MRLYEVLIPVSRGYPSARGRLPTRYSPVRRFPLWSSTEASVQSFSLDLHVLGTPPAFILSQDQTLNENGISKASAFHIFLRDPLGSNAFAFCNISFQNYCLLRNCREPRCFHRRSYQSLVVYFDLISTLWSFLGSHGLGRDAAAFQQTAYLVYHHLGLLSRTNSQLFSFIMISLMCDSLIIVSSFCCFCQEDSTIFFNFYREVLLFTVKRK